MESKDVHHADEVKCARFCADRTDDITTETAVANMKRDIDELQAKLSESLDNIQKASKVHLYQNTHHGRYSEKNSIDYNPSGLEDIEECSEFLCDEQES